MTSALLAFLITVHPFFIDAASTAADEPTIRASVIVETSTLREAGAGPAIASRVRSSAAAVLRAAVLCSRLDVAAVYLGLASRTIEPA